LIFQPKIFAKVGRGENVDFVSRYKSIISVLKIQTNIKTENAQLAELPRAKGMF
jgi:hypothetical protein